MKSAECAHAMRHLCVMSYANILHALTLLLVVLDAERRLLAVLGDERHAEVELARRLPLQLPRISATSGKFPAHA